MPLSKLGGTLGLKRAAHLLRRATFGPTKQQIETFANYTVDQAMAQLFLATLPDPPLPIDPLTSTEWITTPITSANSKNDVLEECFLQWFIGQMLNPSLAYSAREKIVYFLHTHFTTIRSKVSSAKALYFQNQLLRIYANDKNAGPLVNFKELTKKISVDNAMIRLLDGDLNVKGNPNENYARELLELYSIGKGLENSANTPKNLPDRDYVNYSEEDIQVAARVLSGWDFDDTFTYDLAVIDPDTNAPLLPRAKIKGSVTNASSHDNDTTKPKTFDYHFQSATITPDPLLLNGGNATEASALDEISQLVDLVYAQPEAAKYICRKVYRFFVYHHVDDTIEDDIVTAMAQTFVSNNFKLQYVLEELFSSTYFYEYNSGVTDDTFGGIIKSPLDLAVGALRMFNYQLPDITSAPADFYYKTSFVLSEVRKMGMSFFEPYDVAGYDAYHQWPIYHRNWINPNYLAYRYKFIENLIKVVPMAPANEIHIDAYDWVKANIDETYSSNPDAFAPELANYFFPVPKVDLTPGITDARYNYFKSQLLSYTPDWNLYWNTYGHDELELALRLFFYALLQSPEYQLQ